MQYPIPTKRRRSALEVHQLLARFRRSGLSQSGFARREGVCLSTLRRYLKRSGSPSEGTLFKSAHAPAVSFLEVEPPLAPPPKARALESAPPTSGSYRLALCGGPVLEIPAGFCPAEAEFLFRLAANDPSR